MLATQKYSTQSFEKRAAFSLVFAQDQDNFGGGFQHEQSFAGKVAQFGLWETQLDNEAIARMAKCQTQKNSTPEALLRLTSDPEKWNFSRVNISADNSNGQIFCTADFFRGKLISLGPISREGFKQTCDTLRGELPVPTTSAQAAILSQEYFPAFRGILSGLGQKLQNVWTYLGQIYDRGLESWVNPYRNKEPVPSLANPGSEEVCLLLFNGSETFSTTCANRVSMRGVCLNKATPISQGGGEELEGEGGANFHLTLKGMCKYQNEREVFDTRFHIHGMKNGKAHFR